VKRLFFLLVVTLAASTTTAFAATLNVSSWHLWAGSQTLTKATCTLSGTSSTTDTYVDAQNATSSFGSATTLSVSPKSGKELWAFVRFDLSSCSIPSSTGGADSATLTVTIVTAPGSSQTIGVTTVGSTWSGSLTWNGAQSLSYGGAPPSFTTGTTSGVTRTVNVTADVDTLIRNGGASFGWRLSQPSSATNVTTTFGSAENATAGNRPQLVINYVK
jgi:hypothetical protein